MTRRDRRLARAEQLREWADKREKRAEEAAARAEQIARMIPMGQPILEGHHSERRHRADLDRIERGQRGALESWEKASEFRRRADEIERQAAHAVYADDEDATERLRERIEEREAELARRKAANAAARRGADWRAGLTDADVARGERNMAYWPGGTDVPFPDVKNLAAAIRRDRKRLAP